MDYYKILGLSFGADDGEIKKAYKFLALKYHPDRNVDKEAAEKSFIEIQKAYEILSNEKTKESFDQLCRIQVEREKRNSQMEGGRKKFRQDLEEREELARKQRQEEESEKLEKEIERLRNQNIQRQKAQEEELLQSMQRNKERIRRTLSVRWDREKIDVSYERLKELFSPFGTISGISLFQNYASIVFENSISAIKAFQGNDDDPLFKNLEIVWLEAKTNADSSLLVDDLEDYEGKTLKKMKDAYLKFINETTL